MKTLKVLLPMLVFIFAIGMAFATTDLRKNLRLLLSTTTKWVVRGSPLPKRITGWEHINAASNLEQTARHVIFMTTWGIPIQNLVFLLIQLYFHNS